MPKIRLKNSSIIDSEISNFEKEQRQSRKDLIDL